MPPGLSPHRLQPLCRRVLLSLALLLAANLSVSAALSEESDPEGFRGGLPFTRHYPLEEIGNVSRGASVTFDALGRVVVVYQGTYAVLNDLSWIDLADKDARKDAFLKVETDAEGTSFYGALGSWGVLEKTKTGKLRTRSLRSGSVPEWVASSNFTNIVPTRSAVYFGGWNGFVRWDRATGQNAFYDAPGLGYLFENGGKIYLSSVTNGLQRFEEEYGRVERIPTGAVRPFRPTQTSVLGAGKSLVVTQDRSVYVFDGREIAAWKSELDGIAEGNVTAVLHLPDDNIALALEGRGLFIVSPRGKVLMSLTTPEYCYIKQLAARVPGVLWFVTDQSLGKVYYGSPVTFVDQQLGISVKWPLVVHSQGKLFVLAAGKLFESGPEHKNALAAFRPVSGLPPDGAWALAGEGEHLLIGNDTGVYAREPSGHLEPVLPGIKTSRLIMTRDGICFVLADKQIAALRYNDGKWTECAPRVPGVGFSQVGQAIGKSAWLELGVNKAARVTLVDGRIQTRVFDKFPWAEPYWINIGYVGDVVVLSGAIGKRLYFDEEKGALCAPPEEMRSIDAFPYWVARMSQDRSGRIWASHEKGVTCFFRRPEGDWGYSFLPLARDRFPVIQVLEDDIWFSNEFALYHVDGKRAAVPERPSIPVLVSVSDARTDEELYSAPRGVWTGRIPYAKNSVSFRFFAGDWPGAREPKYAFRMNGKSTWSILDGDSLLTLADLREGSYRLDVRIVDAIHAEGSSLSLDFVVDPPWYRAWYAYLIYALATAAGFWGTVTFLLRRARTRTLALERLVQARTEELREAMVRLNEETKMKATLAERDRLAGEIHDSLQQGLSGLMLQLDATLKLADIPGSVRSRLTVARNMASFSRQEVQYALKDMESPFLESGDLGEALRKIAELISEGGDSPKIGLEIDGAQCPLPSEIKHHLLRIGQEAMNNAIRHGQAERIDMRLEYRPTQVVFSVKDDGKGFQPQQALAHAPGHFGLRSLKGRAAKMGGEMKLTSAPGQGTEISVTVPLQDNPYLSNHAV